MFIGGVGEDGHIALNEPYSSLNSRTRAMLLTPSTLRANSRFFDNDIQKVPTTALTIGIETMMEAEEVLILASGARKALAVQHAVEGNISHVWPITALQHHQYGIIACDKDATEQLSQETVRYFEDVEKNNFS